LPLQPQPGIGDGFLRAVQESPLRYAGPPSLQSRSDSTNLADLLERILDKGIVIAGDISISLVDIELLTIKLRLMIASVDKAKEMGIDWWQSDPWLSSKAAARDLPDAGSKGRSELESRLDRIEAALEQLSRGDAGR
jgi:hypothetical protein